MSKAIEILKAIGFEADIESEDFDLTAAVQKFEDTRKELFEAKYKDGIIDQYKSEASKEWYTAHEKALKARLKRSGLFEEPELEKPTKDLLSTLADKISDRVKAESSKDTDAHLKEKRELQDQYDRFVNEKDEEIAAFKSRLEAAEKSAASKIELFRSNEYLNKLYRNKEVIQFDDPEKIDTYALILTNEVLGMAKIDPDTGSVVSHDGTTKIPKPDGKSFYRTAAEIVNDLADKYKMKGKSNGGRASDHMGRQFTGKDGETIDRSASDGMASLLGL